MLDLISRSRGFIASSLCLRKHSERYLCWLKIAQNGNREMARGSENGGRLLRGGKYKTMDGSGGVMYASH
jgi:hypothetical protein